MDQPVETVCGYMLCYTCTSKCLHSTESAARPVCCTRFKVTSDLKPASAVVRNILAILKISCDNEACPVIIPLSELHTHLSSCSPAPVQAVDPHPLGIALKVTLNPPGRPAIHKCMHFCLIPGDPSSTIDLMVNLFLCGQWVGERTYIPIFS